MVFTVDHFWTQTAGSSASSLHELLGVAASCPVQITWVLNTVNSPLGFYLVSLSMYLAVALLMNKPTIC